MKVSKTSPVVLAAILRVRPLRDRCARRVNTPLLTNLIVSRPISDRRGRAAHHPGWGEPRHPVPSGREKTAAWRLGPDGSGMPRRRDPRVRRQTRMGRSGRASGLQSFLKHDLVCSPKGVSHFGTETGQPHQPRRGFSRRSSERTRPCQALKTGQSGSRPNGRRCGLWARQSRHRDGSAIASDGRAST